MAILLAALAAFTNAVTSVMQRIGVESAPKSAAMKASLIGHAVKQKIWLIGFALMLVQFGLQATALKHGQLSTVQPVLTTELLFLLLVLAVWFRYRLGMREWLGAVTAVAAPNAAARHHRGPRRPARMHPVMTVHSRTVATTHWEVDGRAWPPWGWAARKNPPRPATTVTAPSHSRIPSR